MPVTINTKSGGLINLAPSKSALRGDELVLHIDQTANINNGEGEATITIQSDECKKLIDLLNEYVNFIEGKDYVAVIDYNNSQKKTK